MTGREAGLGATEAADSTVHVDVVRGAPTPEELAAVIAVVSEAYDAEAAAAVAPKEVRPSAWQISARSVREPLRRDLGWGTFVR